VSRLLLAAALAAGAFLVAAPADACAIERCLDPVCSVATCRVCYYDPAGGRRCIPA
jgi:hypothetical protein